MVTRIDWEWVESSSSAKRIMRYSLAITLLLVCSVGVSGQDVPQLANQGNGLGSASSMALPASVQGVLLAPAVRPLMNPDLALMTYQRRAELQLTALGAYTDVTMIDAELPATAQKATFELQRRFVPPGSLAFRSLHSEGDGFVKKNVIVRWLQSESDQTKRGKPESTAITADNYRITYKSAGNLAGEPVYIYQVKPRRKAPGLFKGRIYIGAYSGSMRRVEGILVKTPSFFVKRIEFLQDYGDFGSFTMPVHLHSVVSTRIIGCVTMNVFHSNYDIVSATQVQGLRASSVTSAPVPGTVPGAGN